MNYQTNEECSKITNEMSKRFNATQKLNKMQTLMERYNELEKEVIEDMKQLRETVHVLKGTPLEAIKKSNIGEEVIIPLNKEILRWVSRGDIGDMFLKMLAALRVEADKKMGQDYTPKVVLAGYSHKYVEEIVKRAKYMGSMTPKFDRNGNIKLFGVSVIIIPNVEVRYGVDVIRGLDLWFACVRPEAAHNRPLMDEVERRLRGGDNPQLIIGR